MPLAPSTWEDYHGGLHTIVNKNYGVGIDIALVEQRELCDSCTLGKQTRVSFMPKSPHHAKKLLEVIHSDVCGRMQSATLSGKRCFVTLTDDYSHFTTLFLLSKPEVADKFAKFVAFAGTQTGAVVKALCYDNGGEYTSSEMARFCQRRGIEQKFTPPEDSIA